MMAFRETDIMFAAFDIWGAIDDMNVICCRIDDIMAQFDVTDIPLIVAALRWLIAKGHVITEYYDDDGLTFALG